MLVVALRIEKNMCQNKIQTIGCGCSNYIYSSQATLRHPIFPVHRIVEKCLKFLFQMSKWKFFYSIIRRSTRFSEGAFEKPVKEKRKSVFVSFQRLPASSFECKKLLFASSFRSAVKRVFIPHLLFGNEQ